jgi:hypothetical protein
MSALERDPEDRPTLVEIKNDIKVKSVTGSSRLPSAKGGKE